MIRFIIKKKYTMKFTLFAAILAAVICPDAIKASSLPQQTSELAQLYLEDGMDDLFKAWDQKKSKDWTKCKKMALDVHHRSQTAKKGLQMTGNKKAIADIDEHAKVI